MAIITLNNNSLSSVTALPAGVGGKVLQVVSTNKTSLFSTTSTSYVDVTGLSVSITPSSTSNKIFIITTPSINVSDEASNFYLDSYVYLLRNSTGIAESRGAVNTGNTSLADNFQNSCISYLDTPNTTSSITYKIQTKCSSSNFTVRWCRDSLSSTITAYEIAG